MITGIILACNVELECYTFASKMFFDTQQVCEAKLEEGYLELIGLGLMPVASFCHNWGEPV